MYKGRTIFVLDHVEAVAENVVDVYPFWVAGVRHTVIAHEDDVKDVRKIACLQHVVQVPREDIYLVKDFLHRCSVRACLS